MANRLRAGGAAPAKKVTTYLFIDGAYLDGCLRSISEDFFGDVELPINYEALAVRRAYQKVFYYHCAPAEPKAQDEKSLKDYQRRLESYKQRVHMLSSMHGWHVSHGLARQRRRGEDRTEQKEVDVQIAVDLLTHAFKRNMDSVTLLAGDQDFRPAVDAIVGEGTHVCVWSYARNASEELLNAADEREPFDPWFVNSLLQYHPHLRVHLPDMRTPYEATQPTWLPLETSETKLGKTVTVYSETQRGGFVLSGGETMGVRYVHYEDSSLPQLKTFAEKWFRLDEGWTPV